MLCCVVHLGRLQDDEDEDEEGDEERAGAGGVRTGGVDVDAGEEAGDDGIPVQEIDAYWLQRRVGRAFADIDPTAAQKLAEDTFAALQVGGCTPGLAGAGWRHVLLQGGVKSLLLHHLGRQAGGMLDCLRRC